MEFYGALEMNEEIGRQTGDRQNLYFCFSGHNSEGNPPPRLVRGAGITQRQSGFFGRLDLTSQKVRPQQLRSGGNGSMLVVDKDYYQSSDEMEAPTPHVVGVGTCCPVDMERVHIHADRQTLTLYFYLSWHTLEYLLMTFIVAEYDTVQHFRGRPRRKQDSTARKVI